jgi:hypothetical protein
MPESSAVVPVQPSAEASLGNGPQRAEFWREFIRMRCQYPAPKRLEAQLAAAEFHDFCTCGCNSFAVRLRDRTIPAPLVPPQGKDGDFPIFDAWFRLSDEKQLDIMLRANSHGNLSYVEVTCCTNSYPVDDDLDIQGPPFEIIASPRILPD